MDGVGPPKKYSRPLSFLVKYTVIYSKKWEGDIK